MSKLKIGDVVYVQELQQYGRVHTLSRSGDHIQLVSIKTPSGDEIINALEYTIKLATVIDGLLPILKRIFLKIKNWFV